MGALCGKDNGTKKKEVPPKAASEPPKTDPKPVVNNQASPKKEKPLE